MARGGNNRGGGGSPFFRGGGGGFRGEAGRGGNQGPRGRGGSGLGGLFVPGGTLGEWLGRDDPQQQQQYQSSNSMDQPQQQQGGYRGGGGGWRERGNGGRNVPLHLNPVGNGRGGGGYGNGNQAFNRSGNQFNNQQFNNRPRNNNNSAAYIPPNHPSRRGGGAAAGGANFQSPQGSRGPGRGGGGWGTGGSRPGSGYGTPTRRGGRGGGGGGGGWRGRSGKGFVPKDFSKVGFEYGTEEDMEALEQQLNSAAMEGERKTGGKNRKRKKAKEEEQDANGGGVIGVEAGMEIVMEDTNTNEAIGKDADPSAPSNDDMLAALYPTAFLGSTKPQPSSSGSNQSPAPTQPQAQAQSKTESFVSSFVLPQKNATPESSDTFSSDRLRGFGYQPQNNSNGIGGRGSGLLSSMYDTPTYRGGTGDPRLLKPVRFVKAVDIRLQRLESTIMTEKEQRQQQQQEERLRTVERDVAQEMKTPGLTRKERSENIAKAKTTKTSSKDDDTTPLAIQSRLNSSPTNSRTIPLPQSRPTITSPASSSTSPSAPSPTSIPPVPMAPLPPLSKLQALRLGDSPAVSDLVLGSPPPVSTGLERVERKASVPMNGSVLTGVAEQVVAEKKEVEDNNIKDDDANRNGNEDVLMVGETAVPVTFSKENVEEENITQDKDQNQNNDEEMKLDDSESQNKQPNTNLFFFDTTGDQSQSPTPPEEKSQDEKNKSQSADEDEEILYVPPKASSSVENIQTFGGKGFLSTKNSSASLSVTPPAPAISITPPAGSPTLPKKDIDMVDVVMPSGSKPLPRARARKEKLNDGEEEEEVVGFLDVPSASSSRRQSISVGVSGGDQTKTSKSKTVKGKEKKQMKKESKRARKREKRMERKTTKKEREKRMERKTTKKGKAPNTGGKLKGYFGSDLEPRDSDSDLDWGPEGPPETGEMMMDVGIDVGSLNSKTQKKIAKNNKGKGKMSARAIAEEEALADYLENTRGPRAVGTDEEEEEGGKNEDDLERMKEILGGMALGRNQVTIDELNDEYGDENDGGGWETSDSDGDSDDDALDINEVDRILDQEEKQLIAEEGGQDDDDGELQAGDVIASVGFSGGVGTSKAGSKVGIEGEEDEDMEDDNDEYDELMKQIEDSMDGFAEFGDSSQDLKQIRRARKKAAKAGLETGDFDEMEDEILNLSSKPKRSRDGPRLTTGDPFADKLQLQWEKDREKKAERKRQREQDRAESNGRFAKQKGTTWHVGNEAIDPAMELESIHELIRKFLISQPDKQSMSLPPLPKKTRASVHLLGQAYRFKSISMGKGPTRFPILERTQHTSLAGADMTRVRMVFDSHEGKRAPPKYQYNIDKAVKKTAGGAGKTKSAVVGQGANKIGSDNVGHRLLSAMGWTEGQQIGVTGGLDQPIVAVIRSGKSGLGSGFSMRQSEARALGAAPN